MAKRRKLTSRERIEIHRQRFGGCGVFHKHGDKEDQDARDFEIDQSLLD